MSIVAPTQGVMLEKSLTAKDNVDGNALEVGEAKSLKPVTQIASDAGSVISVRIRAD
jgi:hypothetical protein